MLPFYQNLNFFLFVLLLFVGFAAQNVQSDSSKVNAFLSVVSKTFSTLFHTCRRVRP